MDHPILLRTAIDNGRRLQFMAAVLAAATTLRPGVPRWTELTVYRLPRCADEDPPLGGYVVAKVGRSTVAHRVTCSRANPRRMDRADQMPVEERTPCLECQPVDGDPQSLLERTRYVVLQAREPSDLARVLMTGRPGEPIPLVPTGIVADAVEQVCLADQDFNQWYTGTTDGVR